VDQRLLLDARVTPQGVVNGRFACTHGTNQPERFIPSIFRASHRATSDGDGGAAAHRRQQAGFAQATAVTSLTTGDLYMIPTFGRSTVLGLVGASLLFPATSGAQSVHSSTQKYRERNPSAATGRSGGASLSARLLQAKDRTTLVEVTTGELDSDTTPPGALAKVKLKGFDSLGESMFTINATTLSGGGYWKQSYSTFAVSQPFEIQGNIRAIDGKRTDVVTVTASVQRRPDLEVSQLSAPARTRTNLPVAISATIRELNGDVGAQTDCVLTIDGVEAGRMAGLWVDSGDAVSCLFKHAFTAPGSRQLKISAVKVRPGDWDAANNSVEKGIDVVDILSYDYASVGAWAYKNYFYHAKSYGRYVWSTGSGYDWYREHSQSLKDYEGFDYKAYSSKNAFGNSGLASLKISASDGTTSFTATRALNGGCYDEGWDESSGRAIRFFVWSCDGNFTHVYASSYTGTVTYFDAGHDIYYEAGNTVAMYVWNSGGNYVYGDGTGNFTGTSRTIDVSLSNAGGETLSLPVTVSLAAYRDSYGHPETCYQWSDGYSCDSLEANYDYYSGYSYVEGSASPGSKD
jgi:hypothetical protein